jgi:hypothetical protein
MSNPIYISTRQYINYLVALGGYTKAEAEEACRKRIAKEAKQANRRKKK